ncbi:MULTISPECIES: hypothetical protein [Rhodococcus]
MFLKINGVQKHVWRGLDQDGNVIDT